MNIRTIFLAIALTGVSLCEPSHAQQSDAGCAIANAFLGKLLKGQPLPCPAQPQAPAQAAGSLPATNPTSGGGIDVPQNFEIIVRDARDSIRAGRTYSPTDACESAVRFHTMGQAGAGTVLASKCIVTLESERQADEQRATLARQAQADATRAKAQAEQEQQRKAEEDGKQLAADLRSGKRKPETCAQWVYARGQDPKTLDAPITEIAYRPPQGVGVFMGIVEKIDGDTFLLSDQPIIRIRGQAQGYYVVNVEKNAPVFGGENIKLNTVLGGFATQTGTRAIRMTDGSSKTAPILQAVCIGYVRVL